MGHLRFEVPTVDYKAEMFKYFIVQVSRSFEMKSLDLARIDRSVGRDLKGEAGWMIDVFEIAILPNNY